MDSLFEQVRVQAELLMSTESRTWKGRKEDRRNQEEAKAKLMPAGQIFSNWMLFKKNKHTIIRFFYSAFHWLGGTWLLLNALAGCILAFSVQAKVSG